MSATGYFDAKTQPLIGNYAIEASAGTGKTYAITLLWLRLLIEQRIPIESILVSTFTKAATAELSERLLDTLRKARAIVQQIQTQQEVSGDIAAVLQRALDEDPQRPLERELLAFESAFDLAHIKTLHGFCEALIRRHSLELGSDPDLALEEASPELLQQLVDDVLIRHSASAPLQSTEAHQIARVVAHEMGIDAENIFRPSLREDRNSSAHWQGIIMGLLPAARASFAKHKKIQDRHRGGALARLEQLAAGQSIELTKGMSTALADDVPPLLEALESMDKARQAERSAAIHELVDCVRNDFSLEKQRSGLRTFDDLLLTVRNALRNPSQRELIRQAVRSRFQAVIIDECQDSDGIQIEVFKELFLNNSSDHQRCFMVIGDPKQSIYRFRGADLGSYRALLDYAEHAPPMVTNWRSDAPLIEALNAIYAANPDFADHQASEAITYQRVTASPAAKQSRLRDPGPWRSTQNDNGLIGMWSKASKRNPALHQLAQASAAEIQRLLQNQSSVRDRQGGEWRKLLASDIAVLASNRRQLQIMRRYLRALRIPSSMAGRGLGSVLASPQANDVLYWLDAIAHCASGGQGSLTNLLRFTATPLIGFSAAECVALADDPKAQATWAKNLSDSAALLRRHGPLTPLLRLLSAKELRERVLHGHEGERQLTNWRHLGQLLQNYWAAGQRDSLSLRQALNRAQQESADNDESALMRLETDLPAVQLSTIHASKGLEYPIVFCPFMWDVRSPQQRPSAVVRRSSGAILDVGSADFAQHASAEQLQENEEQQRLLYVALTRARHRCYLGMAPVDGPYKNSVNGAEHSALGQLLGLNAVDKTVWREHFSQVVPLIDDLLADNTTASFDAQKNESAAQAFQLSPCPVVKPWRGPLWRTASFSALAAGDHSILTPRDHDETSERGSSNDAVNGFSLGQPELQRGLLDGLGGGTALGNRIHDALEQVLGNGQTVDQAVPAASPDRQHFITAIEQILASPINFAAKDPAQAAPALPLRELGGSAIAELHFVLPVDDLSPAALSRALLSDPLIQQNPQRKAWAAAIADWPFSRLRGFIQGYIDLTVAHGERWYVVDYKTNQLPHYDEAACEMAMLDHDYLLQGRLYILALHRHLRHNLSNYNPQQHLGGIGYWFVRGFPEQGHWQECPGLDALDALDALFAEGQG